MYFICNFTGQLLTVQIPLAATSNKKEQASCESSFYLNPWADIHIKFIMKYLTRGQFFLFIAVWRILFGVEVSSIEVLKNECLK